MEEVRGEDLYVSITFRVRQGLEGTAYNAPSIWGGSAKKRAVFNLEEHFSNKVQVTKIVESYLKSPFKYLEETNLMACSSRSGGLTFA